MIVPISTFDQVSAEIRARKQDGVFFDTNILDVDENRFVLSIAESGQFAHQ